MGGERIAAFAFLSMLVYASNRTGTRVRDQGQDQVLWAFTRCLFGISNGKEEEKMSVTVNSRARGSTPTD
jgi:hypothetical protein